MKEDVGEMNGSVSRIKLDQESMYMTQESMYIHLTEVRPLAPVTRTPTGKMPHTSMEKELHILILQVKPLSQIPLSE